MPGTNKILVIGGSVAVACLTAVALGIGWMQYVSFKQEQERIAQEKAAAAQREAVMAVTAECRDLSRTVNQTGSFMKQFEAEIQSFSLSAAQVKTLADIRTAANQYTTSVNSVVSNLDTLGSDLQSKKLSDETLDQFRSSYTEVVSGFSTSLQSARQAMDLVVSVESESELPGRIEQSQKQTMAAVATIEDLSTRESKLISDINAYCDEASVQQLNLQPVN